MVGTSEDMADAIANNHKSEGRRPALSIQRRAGSFSGAEEAPKSPQALQMLPQRSECPFFAAAGSAWRQAFHELCFTLRRLP